MEEEMTLKQDGYSANYSLGETGIHTVTLRFTDEELARINSDPWFWDDQAGYFIDDIAHLLPFIDDE